MTIYRASASDGIAWITGASRGIGYELALKLAAEGYTVAATARDADQLGDLVAAAQDLPGRIVAFPADVTEDREMLDTIRSIERDLGSIVLAVFNAGVYYPTRGERLDINNVEQTFAINFFGILKGLIPVVELMRARKRGHVMLVGSASSFFGWPSASAYGASKAALNNMAEALRYDFDKMNIRLQIVNPGFVETPLTERTDFRMPFLMPAPEAAKRIANAIERGGFETSFPRRFTLMMKFVRMLPHALRHWLVGRLTGWKDRPLAKARTPRASQPHKE